MCILEKKLSMHTTVFKYTALIFIFFLFSCSVQKRYHRKGLTVNWKKISISSKKKKNEDLISFDKNVVEMSIKVNKNSKNDVFMGPIVFNHDIASIDSAPIENIRNKRSLKRGIVKGAGSIQKNQKLRSQDLNEQKFKSTLASNNVISTDEDIKMHPMTKWGLISFLSGVALTFPIILLVAIGFNPLAILLPVSLLVTSGVLHHIALRKIKNSSKKYKGRDLSNFLLILSYFLVFSVPLFWVMIFG